MVRKTLANGLWTKCTYVWMGLRTYAVPSAKGSHTIPCKLKFVGFLHEHKENWMRRVSFPCAGCPYQALSVLCSPQVRRKLINRTSNSRHTRMVQRVSGALVYTRFNVICQIMIIMYIFHLNCSFYGSFSFN